MNATEMEGTAVVAQCENALKRSDTDAVMNLYPCGGVFMPQHFSSSVGAGMVGKTYTAWRAGTDVVRFSWRQSLQRDGRALVPAITLLGLVVGSRVREVSSFRPTILFRNA